MKVLSIKSEQQLRMAAGDAIPIEDSTSGLPGRPPSDRDERLNQLNGDLDLPDIDLVDALMVSVLG